MKLFVLSQGEHLVCAIAHESCTPFVASLKKAFFVAKFSSICHKNLFDPETLKKARTGGGWEPILRTSYHLTLSG